MASTFPLTSSTPCNATDRALQAPPPPLSGITDISQQIFRPPTHPRDKALLLKRLLDLDGCQAEQALKVTRVCRSFNLLQEREGISIIEQMKKNHSSLLDRLQHCPLLPAKERAAIQEERGDELYLTKEEFELVEEFIRAPWKLSHTTNAAEEAMQDQKLLSLHQRRLDSRDTRSNAHTQEGGTIDNVFFSCDPYEVHSPAFLAAADTVFEVDWKQAAEIHPKKFAGIWGSDHFYRYLTQYRSPPCSLGGTLFSLRYRREVSTGKSERCAVKEYWFTRDDGTRLLFTVNKGEEISTGESIRIAMALRFIELARLAGPRFRHHVLDKRKDIAALSHLFKLFFSTGEFEVHIPGKFSLKKREGIQIYANEASSKGKNDDPYGLNQELLHAMKREDLPAMESFVKRGANPDGEVEV